MGRVAHDFGCGACGATGRVPDEVIVCPQCGASIEGQPIRPESQDISGSIAAAQETLGPEASRNERE